MEHLWVMLALGNILWATSANPLRLLDFWWHLKVGEVIYTTKSIPRTDFFSFTAAGREFIYQNWLSELAYYLVYKLGGVPSLLFLHALAMTLAFGLVLYLCWGASRSLRMAAACTMLAEVLALRMTNARPQVFSFPLFAAFYLVLQHYRRRRGNHLWLLPPLMALWTNVHGAFVLGLGLVLMVMCAEFGKRVVQSPGAEILSSQEIATLGLIFLLTLLATGLNPEGYGVFSYVRSVQSDPASQNLVMEWQAPNIKCLCDLPFFGAMFLGFMVFIYSTRRIDFTELVLFCAFAWLGLASVRNVIWFALIMAPILAGQLPFLDLSPIRKALGRFPRGHWMERCGSRLQRSRSRGGHLLLNYLVALVLVMMTVLLSPWVRPHLPLPRLSYGLVDPQTPLEAMRFIKERGIRGRIFHPQHYGDYLIWSLYPEQRAFIDGRVHLYGERLARDYLRILDASDWEALLAKYQIQFLLLDKTDAQSEGLLQAARTSDAWEEIYQDRLSVMYEKKQGPN